MPGNRCARGRQQEPVGGDGDVGPGVHGQHIAELSDDDSFEVAESGVVGSELVGQGQPRDKLGLRDISEAMTEPYQQVDLER